MKTVRGKVELWVQSKGGNWDLFLSCRSISGDQSPFSTMISLIMKMTHLGHMLPCEKL